VLFGWAIARVPMPVIGAILIIAGYKAISPASIIEVWLTKIASRLVMTGTLVLTLVLPIQYAVLAAVAVTFVQQIYSSSVDRW